MTIRFFTPMVLIATILSRGEIFSAEISIQNYSIKDVIFHYKNNIENKRTSSMFQLLLFNELQECYFEDEKEDLHGKIKIVNTYLAQDSVHQENNRKICLSTNETDYKILKEPEAMTEEDYFSLQVCCAYFHTKYFLAIKEENYQFITDDVKKEQIKFFIEFSLLGNLNNYNAGIKIDKIDESLVHFQRSLDFLFSSDIFDSLIKKYVKNHQKNMKELFPESDIEESDEDSESILVSPPSNLQSVAVNSIQPTQGIDISEDTLESTEEDLVTEDKIDVADTSVTVEPVNNPAEKTATETITVNKQAPGVKKKPSKPIKNNPESALHSQNTFLGLFIVCLVAAGGGFYWFPEECSGFFKKSFRYIVQNM